MKIQKSHTPATELLSFIAYLQAWLGGWAAEVVAVQKGWTGNKLVQGESSAWFPNYIGVAISPPSFPLSLSLSLSAQATPMHSRATSGPFPLSLSLSLSLSPGNSHVVGDPCTWFTSDMLNPCQTLLIGHHCCCCLCFRSLYLYGNGNKKSFGNTHIQYPWHGRQQGSCGHHVLLRHHRLPQGYPLHPCHVLGQVEDHQHLTVVIILNFLMSKN